MAMHKTWRYSHEKSYRHLNTNCRQILKHEHLPNHIQAHNYAGGSSTTFSAPLMARLEDCKVKDAKKKIYTATHIWKITSDLEKCITEHQVSITHRHLWHMDLVLSIMSWMQSDAQLCPTDQRWLVGWVCGEFTGHLGKQCAISLRTN